MIRIPLVLMVAGLVSVVWVSMQNQAVAQNFSALSRVPANWDARIPVPPNSRLLSSTTPRPGGNVFTAEFLAQRSYHATVAFYEAELPRAGFTMGPVTASTQRRLYQRTFTDGTVRNKLTIHTRPGDKRDLLTITIRYMLPPGTDTSTH